MPRTRSERLVVGGRHLSVAVGYRLTNRFRVKHRRVPVLDRHIRDNILAVRGGDQAKLSAVHRHLHRQFDRLTIDLDVVRVEDRERAKWMNFMPWACCSSCRWGTSSIGGSL